ncbi:MAG: hypothetical protein RIC55_10380 [Pirellulaceae bacterium]
MLTQLRELVALYDRTDQDASGDLSAADFLEAIVDLVEESRALIDNPRIELGADAATLRVVCGEDVPESPDLLIERTEAGWVVFVHPDDGDPAGHIAIKDEQVEWIPEL